MLHASRVPALAIAVLHQVTAEVEGRLAVPARDLREAGTLGGLAAASRPISAPVRISSAHAWRRDISTDLSQS